MLDRPTAAYPSDLPTPAARLMEQAAAAAYGQPNRAEILLWSAQAMYPECLPIYFALYKFYFYKGRLDEAERAARFALRAAAWAGGFPAEWASLNRTTVDWTDVRGPQHFYLFSLKALAFIRLRRGARQDSLAILKKLEEIDPDDSVGASVIRDLVAASGPAMH